MTYRPNWRHVAAVVIFLAVVAAIGQVMLSDWLSNRTFLASTTTDAIAPSDRERQGETSQAAAAVNPFDTFDASVEGNSYSLSAARCQEVFPELFNEVRRAAEHYRKNRIQINAATLDNIPYHSYSRALVRGVLFQNQLYIKYEKPGGLIQDRVRSTMNAMYRAVVANPSTDEPLPDIEFVLSMDDHPLLGTWAYSRRPDQLDVWLMPEFGYYSWPEAFLHGYSSLRKRIQRHSIEWKERKSLMFWRGAFQGIPERMQFFAQTHGKPNIDVEEINWNFNNGGMSHFQSPEQFCSNKYLAHTEGWTHSSRLKYLLQCGSVIILAWPLRHLEFYYHLLQVDGENQNAIAVNGDWSNVEDVMNQLLANDEKSQRIAESNVKIFRDRYLTPAAEACYWRRLIREWKTVMDPNYNVDPFDQVTGESLGVFESWNINGEFVQFHGP